MSEPREHKPRWLGDLERSPTLEPIRSLGKREGDYSALDDRLQRAEAPRRAIGSRPLYLSKIGVRTLYL